jgi:hypothetical protein
VTDVRALAATLCSTFDEDELDLLREDPFEAMSLVVPDVRIELVDRLNATDCSVEGVYAESSRSITVQRAASFRRTRFTALHELGHDQARHSDDVAREIAQLTEEAGRRLEEKIADAFAAAVLIPESAVDDVLAGRAPKAQDVVDLFNHPGVAGSREACCVRMAQRMEGRGYVVLAEGDKVRFCATVGDVYRVARGASQPVGHLILKAADRGTAHDDNTRLRHISGGETPEFYGQAVSDDVYVFAVLTDSNTPPWGEWRPPRRTAASAPEMFCPDCDEISEAWARCDVDPSHRVCSTCTWCECRVPKVRVAEKRCGSCGTLKRVDLFEDGSELCVDCV